ncbi:MAG: SDR family oxidoreductase [Verrucomicrobiota bacterium]|nr:SDR family oxidoreductase [Verrucomicrobiota bacterium]
MDLTGCTALITGASSGIGREFARQLAGRAGAIVLVARRRERLEELRDELTARDPNLNVHIHAADLSDRGATEQLVDELRRKQIAIDLLINNAGVGDHGRFATIDSERLNAMLDVNIAALTNLTRAFVGEMVARKRGAVLNVSSCASFLPLPRMAVYAATKAYVTSFSEALHAEVYRSGVSVSALCPGPVHTEFNDLAQRPNERGEHAPEFTYVSAEEVARVGLEGIERNKAVVVPGVAMKVAMLLIRLTPQPILRLALRGA